MSRFLRSILFACLITGGMAGCQSNSNTQLPEDVDERIDLVESNLHAEGRKWTIEERMETLKTPGVSVAVIHNFKLDWAKGYGFADVREKRKVSTATLFQAASISKSIAALGVLKLAQDKKVSLQEDVNIYLSSWKLPYDKTSDGNKITLANLLSHTAGLNVHGFRGYNQGRIIPTTAQILRGESPANNEAVKQEIAPGTKVQYSGGGIMVAQLVMEDVTNKPFNVYMTEEVLSPLAMTSSFFNKPTGDQLKNLATGYLFDKGEVQGKYKIHPEEAAASLWTTPTDLSKYIIDTQLSLKGKSSKVLTPEFTQIRLTPYKDDAALGVFVNVIGDAKYFQHSGANEGFRALYVGDFEKGNGVVIMVNSENNKILSEILLSVADVYKWDGYSDSGIKLSEEKLKTFEGFYQAAFNDDLYLQIQSKGKQLLLRQLWDGQEILFDPQSEFEFLNKEMSFPLKFSRNASGQISQVLAFNRDVWKRDDTYKAKVRTAVNISAGALKSCEGKYQVASDKNLIALVTAGDDHLLIKQLWDGKEMKFLPESEVDFFLEGNPYRTIRFSKTVEGKITGLVAFGRELLDKIE